jgi:hypothetical protein
MAIKKTRRRGKIGTFLGWSGAPTKSATTITVYVTVSNNNNPPLGVLTAMPTTCPNPPVGPITGTSLGVGMPPITNWEITFTAPPGAPFSGPYLVEVMATAEGNIGTAITV